MEAPKNLFNTATERLANPFIFSFLVAWLCYNWRIPIALFWYDKTDIWAAGYQSLFDLIQTNFEKDNTFTKPLAWSFGITILLPFLRLANAGLKTLESKVFFKITGNGNLSAEQYVDLHQQYTALSKSLGDTMKDYGSVRADLIVANKEISRLTDSMKSIVAEHDGSKIAGNWEIRYPGLERKARLSIWPGNASVQLTITENGGDRIYPSSSIVLSYVSSGTLNLILQVSDGKETSVRVYQLQKTGVDSFAGYENSAARVSFARYQ